MKHELSFGQWLRQRRTSLNLTQAELAERVGCSVQVIGQIEANHQRPAPALAEQFAACLEIAPEERAAFLQFASGDTAAPRSVLASQPKTVPAGNLRESASSDRLTSNVQIGSFLKEYQLWIWVGTGRFGEVYHAYQPSTRRDVAIKMIRSTVANHPTFIRRFEVEAQQIAHLEHPHIVPLYDFWREPDNAYLVTHWIQGSTLRALLAHGPVSLDRTIQVLDQIGSALIVAHQQQIVHGNMKPSNILLDEKDHAYLTDFGMIHELTTVADADLEHDSAGNQLLSYLAPEQMLSATITKQTDVYHLGLLLYEMLTGRHPFADAPPETRQRRSQAVPPLRVYRPDLPEALNKVIQQATAQRPAERYLDVLRLIMDTHQATGIPLVSLPFATMPNPVESAAPPIGFVDTPYGNVKHTYSLFDNVRPLVVNPYKGLRAFRESDADDFFGREALTQRLVERMAEEHRLARFLAVVGPSGSGKSSLVQAGLIPTLRRGALPGSEHWFVVVVVPGAHPLEELEEALLRVATTPLPNLLEHLQADERGLLRAVSRMLPDDTQTELVLVIDQFEEIFTMVEDEPVRRHLLNSLIATVTDTQSKLHVIITLRADYYHGPLQYTGFSQLMQQRTEVVVPFTSDELRRAIAGPAARAFLNLEPGLIATLIADVEMQPGALPLLQYVLTDLFEQRTDQSLTREAYHSTGGLRSAIARRADQLYDQLDEQGQEAARQIFLRLITLGEGVEDTRRRVRRTELEAIGVDSGTIRTVIDMYGRYRLLTFDRDSITREPTVEVAHEALIRMWGRLRVWLVTSRENLRIQRRLLTAVAEWSNADRDSSFLATGVRLAQFESLADSDLALSQEEQEYLQASVMARDALRIKEAERKAREAALERRSRSILWALVAVLLIAVVVASLLTFQTRRQLEIATAQRIALAAQSQMLNAPETALLLAYEGVARHHDPLTEQALRDALDHVAWQPIVLNGHTAAVGRGDFSPDGQQILTASDDGTARLWDLTGKQLAVFEGHTGIVQGAVFSPDGQQVLTASGDGTARLWNKQGQPLVIFKGHTAGLQSADFTKDGQQILTTSDDGTVRLWTITGQPLTVFEGHTDTVHSAVFSADEQLVLTASDDGTARLWNRNGESLTTFKHDDDPVERAEFSPDGQQVLTASGDQTARLWDLSGQELAVFKGHTGGVQRAMFSPDGKQVLTASLDQTVRLWDLSGQQLAVFKGHTDRVNRARFSPDGQYILSASLDHTARLWDLSGQQLAVFSHLGRVGSTMFSPDGKHILTTSFDHTARLWTLVGPPVATFQDEDNGLKSAIYSADGKRVLTASADKTARLWDANGQLLMVFKDHSGPLARARFSPDEQQVLTAAEDGTVSLWDLSGRLLTTFSHTDEVFSDGNTLDGQRVLTAADDGTVQLWDLSGQHIATFKGHTDEVTNARLSPNGQYVLTTSQDATARLWDVSGKQLTIFKEHTEWIVRAIFSLDGQHIVSVSDDDTARLWDLSGKQLAVFPHNDRVVRAVFSPDGQRVVTISQDATARMWDLTGKQLAVFSHTGRVVRADFSDDGQYLVTASADQTARLWNTSGQLLATLKGHTAALETAEFSPNGRRILTASMDGTVRQYLVDVQDLLAVASCRVGRGLIDDEINRFEVGTPHFDFNRRTCPAVLP